MSTIQLNAPLRSRASTLRLAAGLAFAATTLLTTIAEAQHVATDHTTDTTSDHAMMIPPPAGVMGAQVLPAGKIMLMYTPTWMHMEGSRIGTRRVSPEEIVTTVPNRFRNMPMQPQTLRIAPEYMDMRMQMFGATLGVTDRISLMAMGTYVEKEMEMITFAGPAGTTRLATSKGETDGLGDTVLAALITLYEANGHHVHAIAGISLPTGSVEERTRMISPMGMPMEMRASYGMQLGTGSVDAMPGLVYTGQQGPLAWGALYRARIPLEGENDQGYRWGDRHELTGWLAYAFNPALSGSLRFAASTEDSIDGRDPLIMGPFQGTNPDFYGGDRIEVLAGLSGMLPLDAIGMARIGVEAGIPIYQDLNGPQLERDWSLTFTVGARF